jgi:hypothetical protein
VKPRCAICGSIRPVSKKYPETCNRFCYWTFEGWIGWNARRRKVVIRDARALTLFAPRLSYPKAVATARMLGWTGKENVKGTIPVQVLRKAA